MANPDAEVSPEYVKWHDYGPNSIAEMIDGLGLTEFLKPSNTPTGLDHAWWTGCTLNELENRRKKGKEKFVV